MAFLWPAPSAPEEIGMEDSTVAARDSEPASKPRGYSRCSPGTPLGDPMLLAGPAAVNIDAAEEQSKSTDWSCSQDSVDIAPFRHRGLLWGQRKASW
mmetsp:Transcript_35492/g.99695  ORF Transcript_35492/g.99695 Transcript_35492/m.99695 type:complete len:97 (-) Transcript_35492:116-406(-)